MTASDGRDLPRLLKVADAAAVLGVGKDWVYRRIESGEIPVVELGDTRKNQRIRESDLQAFIGSRVYPTSARHRTPRRSPQQVNPLSHVYPTPATQQAEVSEEA